MGGRVVAVGVAEFVAVAKTHWEVLVDSNVEAVVTATAARVGVDTGESEVLVNSAPPSETAMSVSPRAARVARAISEIV